MSRMSKEINIFSPETQQAIEKCIKLNIPFAVVLKPKCKKPEFFASFFSGFAPVTPDGNFLPGFSAGFFSESPKSSVYVPAELKVSDILNLPMEQKPLEDSYLNFPVASTSFMPYYAIARNIIDTHKRDDGKTVLSRIIRFTTSVPLVTVASRYFASMTTSFRYIFFTPETGLWLGASPELLYEWKPATGEFRTMSLAGTRKKMKKNSATTWDDKNIDEHNYVTGHIASVFDKFGVSPQFDDSTLRYGELEHICTSISGKINVSPVEVIEKLNPTPAVCGWPVDVAAERIFYNEPHDRNCYGGYISVADNKKLIAFVNLRCAHIRPAENGNWDYAVYAGGGLTKDSVPIEEWREAANKASYLYRAANKGNKLPHLSLSELTETTLEKEFDNVINKQDDKG